MLRNCTCSTFSLHLQSAVSGGNRGVCVCFCFVWGFLFILSLWYPHQNTEGNYHTTQNACTTDTTPCFLAKGQFTSPSMGLVQGWEQAQRGTSCPVLSTHWSALLSQAPHLRAPQPASASVLVTSNHNSSLHFLWGGQNPSEILLESPTTLFYIWIQVPVVQPSPLNKMVLFHCTTIAAIATYDISQEYGISTTLISPQLQA